MINGEKLHAGHWKLDDLLVRMLERLNWYDLLDFFSPDVMAKKLTSDLLHKIHDREKRARYERLGKILRGEPVSFTKWGAEYRTESRDTLFSNRYTALSRYYTHHRYSDDLDFFVINNPDYAKHVNTILQKKASSEYDMNKKKPDQTILDKITEKIIETARPRRIVLFGSAAERRMGPDIDLDLLVVMPDGVHRRNTARAIYRNLSGMGFS